MTQYVRYLIDFFSEHLNGSSGHYNGSIHGSGGRSPANYSRPSSAQSTTNRPSVDSLLDELNSGYVLNDTCTR